MVREFKNGNINIKMEEYSYEEMMEELFWVDCYPKGEPFSLGNFDMGFLIHNVRRNLVYTLSGGDIEKIKEGKTVKLYAREPNEWELGEE